MDLARFHPGKDAASVRACHEIYLAGAPVDERGLPPMSYRSFEGWMTYGWTEDPSESWLALDRGGQPCGWYLLTLPERENRRHAHVRLAVPPARRRAGLGRALVRHAAERARRAGRTMLLGESQEGSPGEAFARALGARHGLSEIHRVLRLDSLPPGHLSMLRKRVESAATGYSPVVWEGLTPEHRLAEIAAVYAAIEDAPQEPGVAAQQWDAELVRRGDLRVAAQGLRFYSVGAEHEATGELVALTQLGVDPFRPDWAFQELTAVTRQHRGHRLGLLVKVAMLDLLAQREPQLTHVITGNADGNAHMIAINADLGFEFLNRWLLWQLEIPQAVEAAPG